MYDDKKPCVDCVRDFYCCMERYNYCSEFRCHSCVEDEEHNEDLMMLAIAQGFVIFATENTTRAMCGIGVKCADANFALLALIITCSLRKKAACGNVRGENLMFCHGMHGRRKHILCMREE
jgi:hypothetical protein